MPIVHFVIDDNDALRMGNCKVRGAPLDSQPTVRHIPRADLIFSIVNRKMAYYNRFDPLPGVPVHRGVLLESKH